MSDDWDPKSIFSKVISDNLSGGSIQYLYMRCRMNFVVDPVQTQTPQFVDMGISKIHALTEGSGLITPANIIQRPNDGAHWSAPNHIFGETASVEVSEAKSD